MGKKKKSKRGAEEAERTQRRKDSRGMEKEDRLSRDFRAAAQVSVSYQCVERMQLLRPRARTRCALVYNVQSAGNTRSL